MITKFESLLQRRRIAVGDSYLRAREYQILAMYIDGYRLKQMPAMLACARKTIDSHMQAAKHRLGAKTLHQLIAMTAAADAIRGLGRSSNRGDAVYSGPGAALKPRPLTFPAKWDPT